MFIPNFSFHVKIPFAQGILSPVVVEDLEIRSSRQGGVRLCLLRKSEPSLPF